MDTNNGRVVHRDLNDATQAELLALVSGLQAKLARATQRKTTLKVTEKGGVSMYGLGRFPVTLYASQWRKLLASVAEVEQFLADNVALLSEKE